MVQLIKPKKQENKFLKIIRAFIGLLTYDQISKIKFPKLNVMTIEIDTPKQGVGTFVLKGRDERSKALIKYLREHNSITGKDFKEKFPEDFAGNTVFTPSLYKNRACNAPIILDSNMFTEIRRPKK